MYGSLIIITMQQHPATTITIIIIPSFSASVHYRVAQK